MKYRSVISVVALFAFCLINIVGGPGCANIIPPQGGPRDSLPPVIVRINPLDSTRNFKGDKITIVFDEYVDLDNYQQNTIISPVPANFPLISRKLNEVTIKIKDTLEENTTYTFNFGNTIKDINEGNVLKNYTYVFATGSRIDSMEYTGSVQLAQTGDIDTTITVMLHRSGDDSAVVKEKPRYIAKLDGKGNFHFRNLAPGKYYLYALEDEGGGYKYMNPEKLFAFADSAIVVGDSSSRPITLYAYALPPKPAKTTANTAQRSRTDKRLKYTTSIKEAQHGIIEPFTMQFEIPLKQFDSSKIRLTEDTTYKPVTGYTWQLDSLRKMITLQYKWKESTLYHLMLEKEFATDTLNQQIARADTIDFRTKSKSEYGRFMFRFRNLDLGKNPVLQIVQNNEVIESFPVTATILSQPLFLPGDYNLRILHDTNKNGKWDAGEFFGKHRQPETVTPITRKVTIRSNWDNEYELDVTPASNANAVPPSSGYPTPPLRNRPGSLQR